MKVLHINFSFTIGGIDNMLTDIMRHQKVKGMDVYLMVINDTVSPTIQASIPKGVKTFFIGRPKSSRNPFYILKVYWLINVCIHPDIIHCHNSAVGKMLKFDKRPKLLTVHDVGYSTKGYKYFDWIVAISNAVKTDIQKTYSKTNISIIYNGVDFSLIKERGDCYPDKTFRIVLIGRLVHNKKGQDLLIQAVNRIRNMIKKEIQLDIIGKGESQPYLMDMVKAFSLSDCIHFVGEKERSWVYHNLKNYDLLVQPSRYEGFGLTIIEGFAAKISVLASDIDGPREILQNGKYGYVFCADNIQSLCTTLLNIINQPCRMRLEKSLFDYEHMKKHFSIKKNVDNYTQLYKSLTSLRK